MTAKVALAGLRVIDFSSRRTGAQTSQTLADFGADVILVEPKGGSPLRALSAWPMWARGKRSIQLDLKTDADVATAHALARGADVIIDSWRPGVAERLGLGYDPLSVENPGLIYCSITGFGRTGPLAQLRGYEGIVAAKLGVNWTLAGMANREGPAFCTAAYASYPASQLAIQGILAALIERESSGRGQRVDTSLVQGLTVHDTFQWFTRVVAQRFSGGFVQTPRVLNGVPTGGLSFRLLIALTKDGKWLQFSQSPDRLFEAMMRMFGLSWMFEDPKWKTLPEFESVEQRVEFWEKLLSIVRSKTAAEWAAEFDRDPNVWGEQFRGSGEVLSHPQMQWNRMAADVDDRDVGRLRSPAAITRMDITPAEVDRPAPRLGEHDEAIRTEAARVAPAATPLAADARAHAPLQGITIVELGSYYAAPFGATLLADLGARVIKLEQPDGDPQRNMLPFPEVAGLKALLGKECVAIDLGSDRGREIAYRIIAKSDIVLQSFRAGAAGRLKLDAESLKAVNPDLIYMAAPGYGEDGPFGHRPAFAPTIGAAAGLAWRNAGPLIPTGSDLAVSEVRLAAMQLATAVMGVGNADGLSAVTVGTAMMLPLAARNRGAGGQHLVTSMLSSVAHAISEAAVEYEGRPIPPTADTGLHGLSALYRLYETEAEWVFLAAPGDRECAALTAVLPTGGALAANPKFADAAARARNDAALAVELAAIFKTAPAASWETRLCAADVACVVASKGPVEAHYMDPGDVGELCDMITTTHHPMLDEAPRLKPVVRFSRSTTRAGAAGLVGQHTAAVLPDFGYDEPSIAQLAADAIICVA